jgi:hypothetical protein
MNAYTIRILDMLKRIVRFLLDHPITPAIPRATAAQAEVVTIITALEAAAQGQTTGSGESEGGVDIREITANDLRVYLKNVNRTGRSLESVHPGISPTFRLPKSGSYPALIAAAQAIIAKATELQADFVDSGLPATFVTELGALLTVFENATGLKHEGGITQVLNTAALNGKASLGVIAATKLDACVRNHYRNQPEMIAAWTHARHIERAPSGSDDDTTPPPDSGSGTGTGSGTSTTVTAG